ncbi:hypothetical protein [Streptomyces corynorhini]|uniref:Uncharacterized protein n=1 Tax=Streptomyces corynorhini TaxID=2282652 RepID=A0A370B640_9ACTN|nr:hypothetical protein [Streptomyces corynorhini]RDG34865.1 hypothetical protein DVH02_28315 [Streptomyces corynorhini]
MAMTPRQLWLAEGRAVITEDVADLGLWDEIAEEAARCEPHAVVRHNQRPGLLVMRDGSITSPQRCRVHTGGDALSRLAMSKGLAEAAGEATGRARMTPVRFGLKFYEPGDYMHVHRDDGKCGITFSCGLTPGLVSMGWLPRLRWLTSRQVADRLGDTPYPDGGETFPVRHRVLTGFDGSRIPHWRTPLDSPSREVLITICFTDLSV